MCAHTYIIARGSRFKRNQSPRHSVMRNGPDLIVTRCNEASREINCLVILFLTRFRFLGNDRPVWHDIISFIFVSCLRKPTGAEVFICFSHSSRPPRTGASRSVVGTDIPVDSHPPNLFPPSDSSSRAAFVDRSFFVSRYLAFRRRRAVVDKSFPSNLTYGFLQRN